MSLRELAIMWLRDKAAELRTQATKAERAYTGPFGQMCRHVGSKYRKAAVLLDDAADDIEDGARPWECELVTDVLTDKGETP